MEKNAFLIYNDIIYTLYTCTSPDDLKQNFFSHLKLLIPFSYGSILFAQTSDDNAIELIHPICYPDYFAEAESKYMEYANEDHLLWLIHCKESTLIRESDLLDDNARMNTPLYNHCYKNLNVFDSMQCSIVYNQQLLGVLSLCRTKVDGCFTDEDMFFMRSLSTHMNTVLHQITRTEKRNLLPDTLENSLDALADACRLTNRELEIIHLLLRFASNEEISQELGIRENTIQKHMQNIFRKLDVASKWELLRMLHSCD